VITPTEKLYDNNGCIGFVRQKDGDWFIQENGVKVSCNRQTANKLALLIKTEFVELRTPHFSDCMRWMCVAMKHRMMAALYVMAKKISGA